MRRRLYLVSAKERQKWREAEAEAAERGALVGYVDQKEFEADAEQSIWRTLVDLLMLR